MKRAVMVKTEWTAEVIWYGKRSDGRYIRIHFSLDDDGERYVWYVLRAGGSELVNGATRTLAGAKIAAAKYANRIGK